MTDKVNNPIIPKKRTGQIDDPFPNLQETHVVTSGKVVLSELPDEYTGVRVTSSDGKPWDEIKEIDVFLEEHDYKVDYRNKLVSFNNINEGKQLLFEYKGTGVLYYPTSMIYTKFSDGEVLQTLDELTDDMYTDKQAITQAIEDARTALSGIDEKTNYAEQQGNYAKTQGDTAKAEATNLSTLKTNVTDATTNANSAIATINTKITEATTAVTNANAALNNFNHQGTYSPATKYFPRNVVDYNGSSYMNIAESTDILPTDTTKWKPVASKGEQGTKGDTGNIADAWQGAYSAAKAYEKGNLTSYNGRVYIAKSASTGNLPTVTSYWEIFSDKGSDGTGSVNSVNGKTGDLTLNAQEVGAIPESQKGVAGGVAVINADGKVVDASGTLVEGAVKSVNGQTGAVTIPVATTSVDGLFSSVEKTKLNGVATGANNYIHPSTHPASIITQDASNRFVTDAEKTAWNEKANVSDLGNLTTLKTTVKTNIVESVNELFQNVSDGKSVVATAITGKGVAASSTDTFAQLGTKISTIKTGVETADATAVATEILTGKTAYARGAKVTGNMSNYAATNFSPSSTDQYIPAGYYNGTGRVLGSSNLTAANIKSGTNIFGVVGNYAGVGMKEETNSYAYYSSGGYTIDQNHSHTASFPIKGWAFMIFNITAGNYTQASVSMIKPSTGGGYFISGNFSNYGSSTISLFLTNSQSQESFISGNTLYVRCRLNSQYYIDGALGISMVVWG